MMWPKEKKKIVRSRHAEEKVSLGAVFGAGLGGATNNVCVSEPRGQGKLTPPPGCVGMSVHVITVPGHLSSSHGIRHW